MDEKLYDITDVCRILGTTSRTLRYYEQLGLIESTPRLFSKRRQYNDEQLRKIKNVMVLRSLGLPVKTIAKLNNENGDLRVAICERKAELLASISSKVRELNYLNEALSYIDDGNDIYQMPRHTEQKSDVGTEEIVRRCVKSFISNDHETVFSYFSDLLKAYLPLFVLERVCADTLLPLGAFQQVKGMEYDKNSSNIIYVYLEYEKLNLCIKFVFHNRKINGFWLNYYSEKEKFGS